MSNESASDRRAPDIAKYHRRGNGMISFIQPEKSDQSQWEFDPVSDLWIRNSGMCFEVLMADCGPVAGHIGDAKPDIEISRKSGVRKFLNQLDRIRKALLSDAHEFLTKAELEELNREQTSARSITAVNLVGWKLNLIRAFQLCVSITDNLKRAIIGMRKDPDIRPFYGIMAMALDLGAELTKYELRLRFEHTILKANAAAGRAAQARQKQSTEAETRKIKAQSELYRRHALEPKKRKTTILREMANATGKPWGAIDTLKGYFAGTTLWDDEN